MQSHTHISFLDKNPTNSVTPLLDPNIASDNILFFIELHQQEQFQTIAEMLKPRAIKASYEIMPNTRSSDELIQFFHRKIDSLMTQNPNAQYTLNASSGDHQHLLTLYEVIRAYPIHCFMVEPNLDQLHWLIPTEKANSLLADKLKIKDFIAISGAEVEDIANSGIVSKSYRDLGAKWAESSQDYSAALGHLNYLAATANSHTLISRPLNQQQLNDPALQTLIDDLEIAEIATRQGRTLLFTNEDCRFFTNGGWLEEYVYGTLLSLKKEIPILQDASQGVEIIRKTGVATVKNEIDIVALANNKLHIVECKTKKFIPGEGNQVIYKLDSLADLLGGTDARAILVSYKSIRPAEKLRAKDLNINIICEDDLADLRNHLKTWLQKA